MKQFYHQFFAKGQPLRHPAQHLLLALTVYLTLIFFSILQANIYTLSLFALFTFLIDLDGLFSIILGKTTNPNGKAERRAILKSFLTGNLFQASQKIAQTHKDFNRLFIHNIVGFIGMVIAFYLSITTQSQTTISIFGAILTHFILDIVDDYDKLSHLHNWLWPIKK